MSSGGFGNGRERLALAEQVERLEGFCTEDVWRAVPLGTSCALRTLSCIAPDIAVDRLRVSVELMSSAELCLDVLVV
jgi:hypothetical protein